MSASDAPVISVLLATHNDAGTLERVLDAYTRLQTSNVGWQIVVVDNASTDATPALLKKYVEHLPLLALRTERRGKNLALNLGLPHCRGSLLVLTDDDALPDANWLQAWLAAAHAQQDFDIFCGQIYPLWPEGGCPEWISRLVEFDAVFAITPERLRRGPVEAAWAWGPNMAIRRSVFDAGFRFNESVGPAAGQYMMGSETELTGRLERAGHKTWYAPDVRVGHIIRPGQLDRKWIVRRGYRLGRLLFHLARDAINSGTYGPRLLGAPRSEWRRLVKECLRSLCSRLRGDFDKRFLADWEINRLARYLSEAVRHAGLRPPKAAPQ